MIKGKDKLIELLEERTEGTDLIVNSSTEKTISSYRVCFLDHGSKKVNDGKYWCHIFEPDFDEKQGELYDSCSADTYIKLLDQIADVLDVDIDSIEFVED